MARNYLFLEDTDYKTHPENYTAYSLFDYAELIQPRDTKAEIEASFLVDFNISYEEFLTEAVFSFGSSNITLYSHNNQNGINGIYVPIVSSDLDKISEWVVGTSNTQTPVTFKMAKEMLLRVRMECSVFPIPIKTKDISDMYNSKRGSIRSVELKDGNNSVSYNIGSRQFWDRMDDIEHNKAGNGLYEFKQFILDPTFAKQVYESWKSDDWETFYSNYLMIGFKPESAAALERKIIHISDLHIGKNGGSEELNNTKNVIKNIIKTFKKDSLKPLVIITGDLVDFGYDTRGKRDRGLRNIKNASKQVSRLQKAGFQVIILPGNHDYSNTINVKALLAKISAEIVLLGSIIPIPGAPETAGALLLALPLLQAAEEFLNFDIEVMGYKPELVAGLTLDRYAKSRFEGIANDCLKGYEAGSIYEYKENFLRPKSNLSIIAIDNQDLEAEQPLWAELIAGLKDGMFLGDGDFRFAKGKVNKNQINQLKKVYHDYIDIPVAAASFRKSKKDFVVLCAHNWVDFYPHAIQHRPELIDIEFFKLVLNEAARVNYDGKKVVCWQGQSSVFDGFMFKFFKAAILVRFSDYIILEEFAKGIDNQSSSPRSFLGFDWSLFKQDLLKPESPSAYYSNSGNPEKDDVYSSHKITNEEQLYPYIEKSDLFMVGHRHHRTDFINYREDAYEKDVTACLDAMDNPEIANNRLEVSRMRSRLQQDAMTRNKEPKQLLMDFLHGLKFYANCNSKFFADSVFNAACDYLITRDFAFNRDAEKLKYDLNVVPEYYSEMNDAGNNCTWREMTINLTNGVVKAIDYPEKTST